jgi:hypothetical protein
VRDGKPISKPVFGSSIQAGMAHLKVPCGQCIGCRLERSAMWAQRITHESRSYDSNCFITLTYSDEKLPTRRSLSLRHMQLFLKRLRKRTRKKFKVFYCGEYGEKKTRPIGPFRLRDYLAEGQRPHYHACLLGLDFDDRELLTSREGYNIYTSDLLTATWGMGHASVGNLTFESAAYVARYCMKKVNGQLKQKPDPLTGLLPYERTCEYTGEIYEVDQEFAHMSRGGRDGRGIGYDYIHKYTDDVYPHDYVVMPGGRRMRPARYYDDVFENLAPVTMEEIRIRRNAEAESRALDNTTSRLAAKEKVAKAKLSMSIRGQPHEI